VSAREAACPNCGATIRFENSISLLVVCEHCQAASYRRDVALESIGLVAQVAPIESEIALRATGTYAGRAFRVLGQVQLDHGAGPWNEWSIVREDGSSAWLAEAQGQYLVTELVPGATPFAWGDVEVGREIEVDGRAGWVVAERGRATVTAVRGELPELVRPGEPRAYADLSGPDGGFGTIDFGAGGVGDDFGAGGAGDDFGAQRAGPGSKSEAVYVGRRVELVDLHLDGTGAKRDGPRRVSAKHVDCPKCAGSIDLRDPQGTVRVVCPYCSALLDPTSEAVRVIEIAPKLKSRPLVPIGSRGVLFGDEYEVLAYLERSITADGTRYPWDEWLLRRADGAYRWLVRSQGHWTFVEPIGLADARRRGATVSYKSETYRHFSGGVARVDHVLGEVYWEVSVGETVRVDDFVAPPRMVSFEGVAEEMVVSAAIHVDRDVVRTAFGLKEPLPRPTTTGMVQPNPFRGRSAAWWKVATVLIAIVFALDVGFHVVRRGSILHESTHDLSATSNAAPARIVTEPFLLPAARNNVEIRVTAPGIDAGRFGVEGLLVNDESGETRDFWLRGTPDPSELTTTADSSESVRVGGLAAGTWRMRLDPRSATSAPIAGSMKVVVSGPFASNVLPVLIALFLCVPPLLVGAMALIFEATRWQQSDHAG
jgi:hypothetical protein